MYNILFVCYGNICRSPMAEMIFKKLIYSNSKRYMFTCTSRATSIEELGNDIYPPVKEKLIKENIPIERHQAKQIKKEDYDNYDYIIVFENKNKKDLLNIIGEDSESKIHLLSEFTNSFKEIDDPWYTGDFDTCFNDINEGCKSLFNYLINKEKENDN